MTAGEHDRVRSESGREQRLSASALHRHPRFDLAGGRNDLALLRLNASLSFSGRWVRPACFPTRDAIFDKRDVCLTAGWGTIKPYSTYSGYSSKKLKFARMKLWKNKKCNGTNSQYNGCESRFFNARNFFLTLSVFTKCSRLHPGMLCAGLKYNFTRKRSCQVIGYGDSGGSLICQV